jgi:hypothetical protein
MHAYRRDEMQLKRTISAEFYIRNDFPHALLEALSAPPPPNTEPILYHSTCTSL